MEIIDALNIAIVSDLHCTSDPANVSTYLHTDNHRNPPTHHPVEALKLLIEEKEIKAQLLLCPGDLTDRMNLTGYNSGWNFIKEIATSLSCPESVIATIGNHDFDSRGVHVNQSEPAYSAKNIGDDYPFKGSKDRFWKDHFELIKTKTINILNFNSTYGHVKSENKGGVIKLTSLIDTAVVQKIENEIASLDNEKFNVMMLHHHPIQYSDLYGTKYTDYDFLNGGDALMNLFRNKKFDIIIHGHKHVPRFVSYRGIPILGAGSFSSLMNLQDSNSKNTFHILNLQKLRIGKEEIKVGEIYTWEFIKGIGWKKPTDLSSKLPFRIGYGYTELASTTANEVGTYLRINSIGLIKKKDLLKQFSKLRYIDPDTYNSILSQLESQFGYIETMRENSEIIMVKI